MVFCGKHRTLSLGDVNLSTHDVPPEYYGHIVILHSRRSARLTLPPFRKSDHGAVFLKESMVRESVVRGARRWTALSETILWTR